MDNAMDTFDAALDIFEAEQVATLSSSLWRHLSKHTSGTRALYTTALGAMIRELLANPQPKQFWIFDAEHLYIADTHGSAMRVYKDYHQGDDMWDTQVSNPLWKFTIHFAIHLMVVACRLQWVLTRPILLSL